MAEKVVIHAKIANNEIKDINLQSSQKESECKSSDFTKEALSIFCYDKLLNFQSEIL